MLTAINFLLAKLNKRETQVSLALGVVAFLCLGNKLEAQAQITPDATLPNNSVVTPNGDIIQITEGTAVGNNLFHSFQEFSVLNGQTAFFDNGLSIENIFSRVTGGSISNIEGLIRANGTANLFLINPNGIMFGENASLNIGGSFIGSTANSIQFSDGSFYSAVNPEAPALLTINIPMGLQYGENPGNIIVQGVGNNTGFADPSVNDFSLIKDFRPAGLQVRDGNTLALIGGNIALVGGNLTAAEGHIELGSVKEGLVKLDGNEGIWQFDYQEVAGLQDIDLVNAASVEVSGNSSGTVNVRGNNISLTDASAILANTSGDGTAGNITLNGAESVNITGVSQNEIPMVSLVSTDTTIGSSGTGADLNIETGYLLVAGGAQVNSAVFGSGKGGNLTVNAGQVELIAGSGVAGSSGLFAPIVPGATGDGGDINLEADTLLVAGGAQAFTLSFSNGKGGDFNIKTREIELNGTSPNGTASGLFTNTFANGDGGNLNIDTESLVLIDGADIGSTVVGIGKAGNVNINANSIELNSSVPVEDSSSISVSVEPGAMGIGGDININTESLNLSEGTQINASVFGSGEGGDVTITAKEIDLKGFSTVENIPTAIFASVFPDATGNSGNVTITTDNLSVSDGAQIAVSTVGSGAGGNLTVTASNSIELTGNAFDTGGGSSGLLSSAILGDGDGGNIDLTTNELIVKDAATISASNFSSRNPDIPAGTGSAGNINVNANSIELDGVDNEIPASITAATFAGGGGSIVLDSETITVENGSKITAETLGEGAGGSIQATAKDVTITSNAVISSSTTGTGDAGTISLTSESLNINREGTITTSTTGAGNAGNINLNSPSISTNGGLITATSESTGNGGKIVLNSETINVENGSKITAETLGEGAGGSIQATAKDVTITNQGIISSSTAGSGNAGEITLNSDSLDINREGTITTSSTGAGNAGNIDLNSPNISTNRGLITATSESTGDGGNIILDSETINVENGSKITAETLGEGAGGSIQATAKDVTITSQGIISSSTAGSGNAGEITLNSQSLKINTEGTVTTSSTGAGNAGNINLNSETINVENGSKITAETLGEGAGGSIQATAKDVTITSEGIISSSTAGSGNAGEITLNSQSLKIDSEGTVTTSSTGAGNAGEIILNSDSLDINREGTITTSSTGAGQAGNINLTSPNISLNQGLITATSEQTGGGDISITTDFIRLDNNSLISTSVTDSTGGGGNITINSNTLLAANNSDIRANAKFGPGGNINITTEVIFTSPTSDIDASSQFGLDGVVEINNPDGEKQFGLTKLPDSIGDSTQLITASCPVDKNNVMAIVGKGGLSENPQQSLRGQSVWQDLRLSSISDGNETEKNNSTAGVNVIKNNQNTSIVEAKSWIINDLGNVELLAYVTGDTNQTFWQHSIRCNEF